MKHEKGEEEKKQAGWWLEINYIYHKETDGKLHGFRISHAMPSRPSVKSWVETL
jgi:hypothetical protein